MAVTKIVHHSADNPWEDSPFRKPRIILGGSPKPPLSKERIETTDRTGNKKSEDVRQEALKAIAEKRCPQCGAEVKKNPEMIGWVQCANFGNPDIKPRCNWQQILEKDF